MDDNTHNAFDRVKRSPLSRRGFLKAAGGLTFLALIPLKDGAYAASPDAAATGDSPVFLALPYVQPGPASRLIAGQETMVLAWKTDATPADFSVTYGRKHDKSSTAVVSKIERPRPKDESDGGFNYSASLTGLALATRYEYTVAMNGKSIAEGYFTTRKARGTATRFVAFGDNSYGEIGQRAIAYHAYKANPDFVMNTGDNVYESGLDNEYARYFFPVYNSEFAHPAIGAPILRTVPFYTVIANHDVAGKDAAGHKAANFDHARDSLGYYTNMYLPLNGPTAPNDPTPITGADDILAAFRQTAGDRFPRMANYSFDYGDIHFLCLDSNDYVDPNDTALQQWIDDDLAKTDAIWKFVVYHHPAFNVGDEHYHEQHMRVLCPLMEKHGVDFVLNGHEHVYQRTMPIRFNPKDAGKSADKGKSDRRTPGTFTIDRNFDGGKVTKADGIIHIGTGAGGKHLYDPGFDNAPDQWLHADDDNVAYNAHFHSARHSFTVFDVDGRSLTLRQIDEFGVEVDKITVTKA